MKQLVRFGRLVSVWVSLMSGCPLEAQLQDPYILMFYNTENLFCPTDDTLSDDDEFTPGGTRHWTWSRYRRKISMLARTITAAGGWEVPEIVALCEVENERVLKDLVVHPALRPYDYRILHRDGPDRRGIDVAMLCRGSVINVLDTIFTRVELPGGTTASREILSVMLTIGADTCLVHVNHWKSKYGGAAETEPLRMAESTALLHLVEHFDQRYRGIPQLIAGDFNDPSGAPTVRELTSAGLVTESVPEGDYDTYKYRGRWESIDHLFLADPASRIDHRAEVFHPEWLLETDERYTGVKPFRTYSGYRYNGGFSDHLPLLLYFSFPGKKGE